MKGVILAAGKGTRMREVTQDTPKPMLMLANRPLLEYTVSAFRESGVTDILMVVQYHKEKIIEHFGEGKKFGVRINYIEQPAMKGTGEAANLAKGFVGTHDFILIFGDIITPKKNIINLLNEYNEYKPLIMLTTRYVEDPWNGAAVYVKNGIVEKIIEKPQKGSSTTHFDNAGIFVFANGIFEILDNLTLSPRGEYELTDAIQTAINRKLAVRAYELQGYWSNISSPEDLISANNLVLKELGEKSVISIKAMIGENVNIGSNVSIEDNVNIEAGSVISNSIVRKNASIGKNAVLEYVYVQENAIVEKNKVLRGTEERVIIV